MTWNPIWPPPQRPKIKTKYERGIIELKKVILVPNSMFFHNFGTIYSLVHLKMHTWFTWTEIHCGHHQKLAKMTNKGNFGIIEPKKLIFVCNSMFVSVIYSLVHLKCTQNSHDLKSNMATIESPKMLSLINWYSSQKILATNQTKGKMRCAARIQIRLLPGPWQGSPLLVRRYAGCPCGAAWCGGIIPLFAYHRHESHWP